MKTFLKTFVVLFTVSFFGSCSDGFDDVVSENLEVTPNNISGVWQLVDVNGATLPDGAYLYVEYIRKDKKFVIYQKFDSMYPRRITGTYSIENDKKKGAILSGVYDYGNGKWNNRYIVSELYEDELVLVSDSETGTEKETCKYIRCNEVPEEILEQAK